MQTTRAVKEPVLLWEDHPVLVAALPTELHFSLPLPFPASRSRQDTEWHIRTCCISAQSPSATQFMITAAIKGEPRFVSEISFIVSFLFASVSSLSTSDLALNTVPQLLFPSWLFPLFSWFLSYLKPSLFLWSISLLSLIFINCSWLLLCPDILFLPLFLHSFRFFLSPWTPVFFSSYLFSYFLYSISPLYFNSLL